MDKIREALEEIALQCEDPYGTPDEDRELFRSVALRARAALAALPSCEGCRGVESALTALRVLVAEKEKATRLQIAWRELYPDDQFYVIPSTIETAFVRLIDSLLGPGENASYLLYEAMQMKDGGRISINGTTYQIRTVDDLEAYLRASPPER